MTPVSVKFISMNDKFTAILLIFIISCSTASNSPSPKNIDYKPKQFPKWNFSEYTELVITENGVDEINALDKAFKRAIEQVYGTLIYNYSTTDKGMLLKDMTDIYSHGFINDYKILEKQEISPTELFIKTKIIVSIKPILEEIEKRKFETWDARTEYIKTLTKAEQMQAKLIEIQKLMTDFIGDKETFFERAYFIETVGYEITDIDFKNIKGNYIVKITPNELFWYQYKQLLKAVNTPKVTWTNTFITAENSPVDEQQGVMRYVFPFSKDFRDKFPYVNILDALALVPISIVEVLYTIPSAFVKEKSEFTLPLRLETDKYRLNCEFPVGDEYYVPEIISKIPTIYFDIQSHSKPAIKHMALYKNKLYFDGISIKDSAELLKKKSMSGNYEACREINYKEYRNDLKRIFIFEKDIVLKVHVGVLNKNYLQEDANKLLQNLQIKEVKRI